MPCCLWRQARARSIFFMDYRIFKMPLLGMIFKLVKAVPIASARENPRIYQQAFDHAASILNQGELLCIFPEGGLTPNGQIQEFRPGILKVLKHTPVPVVPMALQNIWGSFFSRVDGRAMTRPLRRGIFNSVGLNIGPALKADSVQLDQLQQLVQRLYEENV
jgi:1-acyl-sn-glycerol-3-phosphate acyltransferase